jgi:hypothetical protein
MTKNTSLEDRAAIEEALRLMRAQKPGIAGEKVRQFLAKLDEEWDQAGELPPQRVKEMFERFVAEASHVSS